ncbi:MAG: Ig-like domain-containing protein [Verrucomicrobiota bacterium]
MDGSEKIIKFPKNGGESRSWRPMETAPQPGQRVEVKMRDGSVKQVSVTRMVTNEGVYLQYFHKAPRRLARALDINEIESWRNS